jgi:5-methylcytosine-specific restriction endonuclease McrA
MAQEWAKWFYKSPRWLHNRKAYLEAPVDLNGNVVYTDDDGFYTVDEYGYRTYIKGENVVPPRICEMCFAKGKLEPAKVVHHIEHINENNVSTPSVTLAFSNFMRLCQNCHAEIHSRHQKSRVTFDENGNCVWEED